MKTKKRNETDTFYLNKVFPDAKLIFRSFQKAIEDIRDDCIFVIDTNILLVPYGSSKESLDEIRDKYDNLINNDRFFVPGHVVREFAIHRSTKLESLYQMVQSLQNRVQPITISSYPLLKSLDEYKQIKSLEKELNDKIEHYRDKISELLDRIKNWNWNDPVSLMYRDLFTDTVIIDPQLDYEEIESDLEWREIHRIGPGFKDSDKDFNKVGDLIIWETMLSIGRERKKSVVFVTNEKKSDWWLISQNRPLYIRYDLFYEFYRETEGQTIHIIDFKQFLELIGARMDVVQELGDQLLTDYQLLSAEDLVLNLNSKKIIKKIVVNHVTAIRSVYNWLSSRYSEKDISHLIDKSYNFLIKENRTNKIAIKVYSPRIDNTLESEFSRNILLGLGSYFRRYEDFSGDERLNIELDKILQMAKTVIKEGEVERFIVTAVIGSLYTSSMTTIRSFFDKPISQYYNTPDVHLIIGHIDQFGVFMPVIKSEEKR
ncbi:MAG: PIN-like domain-containing protein [Candidatus Hodarchaeales archaeon]|jgi:hypothetical protein